MQSVTFDEFESALATAGAPVAAAEGHGALCGALAAVGGATTAAAWLADLLPGGVPAGDDEALRARNLLETAFDETREALGGSDLEFEPLLPDDEQPLERRVAALAAWCSGFLYGMGTGQLPDADELPDDVGEVLRDFAEISRAVVDPKESEESAEASYAELVEYLRAGTQLVFEELAARGEGTPAP